MPTIKQEMAAVDKRQFDWYDNLSDEDKKSLSMWVLMRYVSSTSSNVDEINEHYLTMTNELVNVNFSDLIKHPELQFRLMQCVGVGTNQFHNWIKPMKRKKDTSSNPKLFGFYEQQFPHFNDEELAHLVKIQNIDEVKETLRDAGLDDKQIKAMLK